MAGSPKRLPASPRKRAKAPLVPLTQHATAPALPADFHLSHSPEFCAAVERVLVVDPCLYDACLAKPFKNFTLEHEREHHAEIASKGKLQFWFELLCSGVISQQVSGGAARSIKRRVVVFFHQQHHPDYDAELGDEGLAFPTPAEVLAASEESLRSCGLSARKAEYLKSIATHIQDGELTEEVLEHGPQEEAVARLVAIKGIGEWSANMFLIFGLRRLNVYTLDDLGVARGLLRYFTHHNPELYAKIKQDVVIDPGTKRKKLKIAAAANRDWKVIPDEYGHEYFQRFAPYQTVVELLMWHLSATNVEAQSG